MSDLEKQYLEDRERLAEARTTQAEARTDLSELRTEFARERNELAKNRTSLANRRTFLAWCRTALAFMTFGFLLEKVDAFLVAGKMDVTQAVLKELGTLGKLAFIAGPLLMALAAWRYYQLEKQLGSQRHIAFALPEVLLFLVILAAALIYVFL